MLGVFLCYDIDDPLHLLPYRDGPKGMVMISIFSICPAGDLLQSLRTAGHARFAIYIDRETGTSTLKTDFTFGIHTYGGCILQDIDSRSASGKQV